MTRTLLLAAGLALATAPLVGSAVGADAGTLTTCATITVSAPRPSDGLPVAGRYEVQAFQRTPGVAPPTCAWAMRRAKAYVRTGAAPAGYHMTRLVSGIGRVATAADGSGFRIMITRVKGPKGNTLDTRLQITNKTSDSKVVTLGAGCIDPIGLLPVTLEVGETVAVSGWCGWSAADVSGSMKWGNLWSGYKTVNLTAGNPKIGWPWINVDGVEHKFEAGTSCSFNTQNQHFEAYRNVDLSGAKDMGLRWVDSTTLPQC